VEDLNSKNKDMSEELRHMGEQFRAKESHTGGSLMVKKDTRPNTGNSQSNRYTFSA